MSDVLVKVEGGSKKFCRSLKKSLWYGMQDLGSELIGHRHGGNGELRADEFWSVKDISFVLKRGECLGLIGQNGAGKSTLLKMLNGLIKPDEGQIEINGRVGALIELGAGFNPILTGRENIYVNGSILGFSKAETDRKLDAIIDFAEIEEFIDSPVQNYSSGMKVRLGFAVASQMEPDVLLIDEVLAVGDIGFRAKCLNVINSLMQSTAMIFVSHTMPQVSRICSDILVMDYGKSVFHGKDVSKGIDFYYGCFESGKERVVTTGEAIVHTVRLESEGAEEIDSLDCLGSLTVNMEVTIDKAYENPNISIMVVNQELQNVFQCSSFINGVDFKNIGKRSLVSLNLGKTNLNPGLYSIDLSITSDRRKKILLRHQNLKYFTVTGEHIGFAPVQVHGEWTWQAI